MDKPIELVIFDCDGVLIDSERLAVRVDVVVLEALGWTMTETEVVERFVGRSTADFAADVEAHLGRPLPEGWENEFRPLYEAAFRDELAPVDGIEDALDRITLPWCVASSSTHHHLRTNLGHTGLLERFEGSIFSASEVPRGKPAPDLFLHAATRMGTAPAACIVVEDSRHGIAAARAAGMRSLGYSGGLTPAAWLEGPGTTVFDDMRDLPRLIAEA